MPICFAILPTSRIHDREIDWIDKDVNLTIGSIPWAGPIPPCRYQPHSEAARSMTCEEGVPDMRAPRRRRPRKRTICVPQDIDLQALAARVTYVGSAEHKDSHSFAGPPRPRGDASLCPRDIEDISIPTEWLRSAVRRGSVGAPWEGDFPRYAWHKEGETVFEARLVNRGDGSYKGYPLTGDEWPPGIEGSRD